jgi:hypothetical protein
VADQHGEPIARAADQVEISAWAKHALGISLFVVGCVLLYLTVTLWPAINAAKLNKSGHITWFGFGLTLVPDASMMLLVVLVSALGSYIHATVSFSDFVGNRQLASSWMWWYLLRVFVGSSLAVIFYFAIRGGFFSGASNSTDLNVYGIAALAGLVGLFSKQATDKLREIFDTAFKTGKGVGDDVRGDSIVNPAPTLEASEPAAIMTGPVSSFVLVGTGFVPSSIVTVTAADGKSEPRKVRLTSSTTLKVTLLAKDAKAAGKLTFTVTNPEPGGGTSQPLVVDVTDPA